MRACLLPLALSAILGACGTESAQVGETENTSDLRAESDHSSWGHGEPGKPFAPPAASDGYTRFVTPVIKDIPPDANISHCQFIQAPLDRDVDVIDVQGHQSYGGHHVVAYAITANTPVGTSRLCKEEDNLLGGFLGGIGGEAGGGVALPEGVAFRLPKGSAIMVNTHFVNNSDAPIDGQSVIDFKFAEPKSGRLVASLFSNGTLAFSVPAKGTHEAIAECTMPREMKFILFTNHMHEWGAKAKTEVVRADGRVELIHEDRFWTPELAFRADYSKWKVDAPLTLAKGDRLRTYCSWDNTTDAPLKFPGEMCFGVGFFLSTTSSSPTCANGTWIER